MRQAHTELAVVLRSRALVVRYYVLVGRRSFSRRDP